MKAKDITECESCPLYGNDCMGGWTSGGGGIPIEPPCCSWNGDDEIYAEMYSLSEREPTEEEIQRDKEIRERKEKERIAAKEKLDYEEVKKIVYSKNKHGSSPIKDIPYGESAWWCYHCNKWVTPYWENWTGGIGEAYCPHCLDTLVHSSILENGESKRYDKK